MEESLIDPRKLMEQFCPVCNEAVTIEKAGKKILKRSCQKCGTELRYRCLNCKTQYKRYISIYMHIWRKYGSASQYSCSFCAYVTTSKDHLQAHKVRKHSNQETAVNCKKCGAQLKNSYSLSSHLQYCGKAPSFVCSFCDFKTIRKQNLQRHLIVHSSHGSTSSSQTNISNRNYNKYDGLIIRHCKHCNETIKYSEFRGMSICPNCKSKLELQCAKCDFESNIYSRMRYHIESKCGARESPCPKCDKMLPSVRKLHNHLQSCSKKFTRELCKFKTTNKYKFNSHAKQSFNRPDQISRQNTKNEMYDEEIP